jgi:HlyD family secretion protein
MDPMTNHDDKTAKNELLGDNGVARRPWLRIGLALAALLARAARGGGWTPRQQQAAAPRYDTQAVARGALTVAVSANGTLQPTKQVAIGSELSGTVAKVHVDINDRVKQGQVLVELDTSRLADTVAGSRAALAAARAAVQQAQATRAEADATLRRQEEVFRISGGRVPSATELDTARAAGARAAAVEASARANANEAEAALRANETNFRKSSIRSPIDGVVLARSVEPGQAVAASLQAVTLLTLAEDLTQMKLQVNVDEADVGQVKAAQRASFNVAAYPNRRYPATINRVGFGPTTKDNVVTYLADLAVDNSDLSLRPGMTATASIVTVQRQDALLVPNAALRFNPDAAAASAAAAGSGSAGGLASRLMPRMPRGGGPRSAGTDTAQVRQVFVLQDGAPVAVPVTPGASDGRNTEVTSERLREGMQVIVGQRVAAP